MTTQPATRDLSRVIDALSVAEEEFTFQADRLAGAVTPDTANESEHLADLRGMYREAAKASRILRRYHAGRVARRGGVGVPEGAPPGDDPTGPQAGV